MGRLGIFLFTVALLFYGLLLSRTIISKLFIKEGSDTPSGLQKFMDRVNKFLDNKGATFMLAFICFVIGVWNLFAPNFGTSFFREAGGVTTIMPGGATIVGALLPSLALIMNAAVIHPEIISLVNLDDEKKAKYFAFIDKIKDFMGVITLVLAFLHMAFFKAILF